MREIVLDTETTGFDPQAGDRIVEIGAVELFNHMPTGQVYHQYINPQRAMPAEAFAIHGLGDEFLSDKPLFADIAAAFVEFVGDARLVIHNAAFDMKFLNAELGWAGLPALPDSRALDTLELARRRFPGAQNSLDALCRRFSVDNSAREKHGALLDSELLAEVYLELIGGRQPDFGLAPTPSRDMAARTAPGARAQRRPAPLQPRVTSEEAAAHAEFLEEIGEAALWLRLAR